MDEPRLARPSPAMVVALLALFVALTGTAVGGLNGKKKLGANTVGAKQLKSDAVTAPDIAPNAVETANLAPNAVATGKLAPDAVQTGNLAPGAVQAPDLAPGAVDAVAIAPNAVGADALADQAVRTRSIADGSIKNDKIAGGAILSDQIAPGAVRHESISDGAIFGNLIGDSAITSAMLANGSVEPPDISPLTPTVGAKRTTSQSIPFIAATTIGFNAEDWDTAAMHDNTTNNSRLVIPVTGVYQVTGTATWAADLDGFRQLLINKTGVGPVAFHVTPPAKDGDGVAQDTTQTVSAQLRLVAGDIIELQGLQVSSTGLSFTPLDIKASPAATFQASWMGPA